MKRVIWFITVLMLLSVNINARTLVLLMDASSENYQCNELLQDNKQFIKRNYLNKNYIKNNRIKKIFGIIFSQKTKFIVSTKKITGRKRAEKLANIGSALLENIEKKMPQMNKYKTKNGKEKYYSRDVVGALISTFNILKDRDVKSATIVVASNMIQGADVKSAIEYLKNKKITLPKDYKLIVLAKAFACDDTTSQLRIEKAKETTKESWLKVLQPRSQIEYKTDY